MMVETMGRVIYILPNMGIHLTQDFLKIEREINKLTKFNVRKQSKMTGLKGGELSFASNEPADKHQWNERSSRSQFFTNPFSPFIVKNYGLKTKSSLCRDSL